jgi:hypothetical protein
MPLASCLSFLALGNGFGGKMFLAAAGGSHRTRYRASAGGGRR